MKKVLMHLTGQVISRHTEKINLPNYSDKMMVCVFVPIKDKVVKGGSSLLFTQKSAFAICDSLLNRTEGSTNKITEIEESALKELANIILGNFLTPFAHSLLIGTLLHSPAVFENDISPEVIKHTRSLLTKYTDHDTVVNIAFGYEHDNKMGDINIVFNSEKINYFLKALMVIPNG